MAGPAAIKRLAEMGMFGDISYVAATSVIPENAEQAVRVLHRHGRANELGFVFIATKSRGIRQLAAELADTLVPDTEEA